MQANLTNRAEVIKTAETSDMFAKRTKLVSAMFGTFPTERARNASVVKQFLFLFLTSLKR